MARFRTLAAALAACALTACTQSKSNPTSNIPQSSVTITPAATSVIADGTHTVRIDYLNAVGGSAMLTTSQGTFESSGVSTVATSAASGSETLRTCTLGAAGCTSATTTVSIVVGSSSVSKTISFVSLATACLASCSDASCSGLACTLAAGGTGVCAAGTCTAGSACTPTPASATTETSCSDGIDNDCNSKKDCAESSCDGQPCKVGSPSFVCRSGACTDGTTGLSVTVSPARTRLPAVANMDVDIVVSVAALTDPASNVTVAVSLGDASLGSITPASAATDARGVAHFTFRTTGATGAETITATLTAVPTVSATATLTIPRMASLRLVPGTPGSVQYAVMGAKGSGWQDSSWLKVLAVDDLGLPYPDGLPVRFEHRQLGGASSPASRSTLGLPLAADTATCVAANGCVGYQTVTASTGGAPDSAGIATAWIYSGTVAGTLPVTASAGAAGASFSILLPTIAVVGAKASGTNFSVICSPRNVPALAETDCAISLVDAPFTCEALLKDRFDNVLGRSTQVVFASEAGSVGQIVSTPAYDPAGAAQTGLGLAVQKFQTLGNGLPFDVAPVVTTVVYDVSPLTTVQLTEPSVDHAADGCGLRTHNPRDGVVTVIAIADGEEAFFDANGNGSYDAGEPFVDLGEPFIDQDDSGTWTQGEWFLDLDGNGTWSGPNGRWDANTKIWTQTFVVFTGTAATFSTAGGWLGTRIVSPTDWIAAGGNACTPTPWMPNFVVTIGPPATSQDLYLVASDQNLNFLQTASAYSLDSTPTALAPAVEYRGLASYADETGLDWRYWPCVGNVCESQCRAGACLMRPEFTRFTCGYATSASVTAGTTAGTGQVRWNVDVPYNRYGSAVLNHVRQTVGVTVRP